MKKILTTAILAVLAAMTASAQNETTPGLIWSALHHLEYEVNAGINIGGTSPLPLPAEIRSIDSYSPNLNLSIGATATKWFGRTKRWGLVLGIGLDTKGMQTRATVKNYGMEIIQDGDRVSGNWTGKVQTRYRGTLFTVPLMATYKFNPRFKMAAGPYLSVRLNGEFVGYVYDGYMREGGPTGNKVVFDDDKEAPYDFSSELRRLQWGGQISATWYAFKHLTVHGNLMWGFNDIFRHDFKTITFTMYPIYLNAGFGYAF